MMGEEANMTPADASTPDGISRAGDTLPVDAAQSSAETRPLTAPPADELVADGMDSQAGAASTGGPADSGARAASGAYPKRTLGLHASGATPRPTSSLPRATGIPQSSLSARRTGQPARTTRVLPAVEMETPTEAAVAPQTTPLIASEATPTPTAEADARETLPATPAIEASAHSEEDETPTLPRLPRVAPPTSGHQTAPPARQDEAIARVTRAMRALTVVHDDATLATRSTRLLAESERRTCGRQTVTLVAGSQRALRIPASPGLAAKHPRARRALASAVMLAASLSMVLGMLYAAHPAGTHQVAAAPLELVAAQFQKVPTRQPESAWGTAAGGQTLGLGGGAGPGVKAPGSAGIAVKKTTTPPPPAGPPPQGIGVSPAPFAPWPPQNPWMQVPGRSAFTMQPVAGYYSAAFGQCTWWAQYQRRDENLGQLGDARYWSGAAQARGMHVSNQPAPGATVVFQPGVQGAGGGGHVAHVIAVYPGGWFLISEMNFYWNGGGWGRVDYRYAHSGGGVLFIY
jgi:hypothetical protein